MICLLLLPLLFLLGSADDGASTHMTEMCRPQITRHELYTLAIRGATSAILGMIGDHNGNKPISYDKAVEATTMFSKQMLAGQSVNFVTRLMHIQCHLNKPANSSETAGPVEEAFMCIWEKAAEKCYKYKDKKEGEIEPIMESPPPPANASGT